MGMTPLPLPRPPRPRREARAVLRPGSALAGTGRGLRAITSSASPTALSASCHERKVWIRATLPSRATLWIPNSWASSTPLPLTRMRTAPSPEHISTHADAREPENGLAEIPHFTVLELEHLPGLEHCLDPIAHLVIASIDGLLYRRWTGRHPLDVWRPQVKPHVEFAPVPRFDSPAQQFHVLLRHRLPPFLGEAFSGSTGLVDVGVVRCPHDQTIRPYGDERETVAHATAPAANRTA